MRSLRNGLVCLLLTCLLLTGLPPVAAEENNELADWTVMLYLCGTDLETDDMAATVNLGEICQATSSDSVNFVMQTGGTKQWHTLEAFDDLEIASDRLQRYAYRDGRFTLRDEQPLANMADASTLTSFIRWSAQSYPAKRYALVLWDHGGGSFSGIISDELHDGSIMQVEDLARALRDSGVFFEAIVPDACLMATLEVAQALAPYGNYLVASEAIVPNEGGPYTQWLQYLYDNPDCDGAALGKAYDKAMMDKYASISNAKLATITYATIDLRKIDAVSVAFDAMFAEIGTQLDDPALFSAFGYDTKRAQSFSRVQYDLIDLATRAGKFVLRPETVNAVVTAVDAAVVDNVHGSAMLGANGLSFYYVPKNAVPRLDHYARICISAPYLAFLDRVNMSWSAPLWVYEQVERKPDISRADYTVIGAASLDADGIPTFTLTSGLKAAAAVDVLLYRYDPQEDAYVLLGTDVKVHGTFDEGVFRYAFNGRWLTIGGHFAQLNIQEERDTSTLYSIPFVTAETLDDLLDNDDSFEFRASYDFDADSETLATDPDAPLTGTYTLHGVWNMTDTTSDLPDRDVWDIKDFDENTVLLLQRAVNIGTGKLGDYVIGDAFVFHSDDPKFEVQTLPSGPYAMCFTVVDVFGQEQRSAPIKMQWDAMEQVVTYTLLD